MKNFTTYPKINLKEGKSNALKAKNQFIFFFCQLQRFFFLNDKIFGMD
jgi:hypothetical protein